MNTENRNKRWIINVILFTLIFLVLFVNVSYLFRVHHEASTININRFKKEKETIDVLWVGGSSTYVYWMPLRGYQNYGMTSYNYSGDSMSPVLVKNLLIESRKHQKSKLYVIDIRGFEILQTDPAFYTEEYCRKYIDAIPYSANRNDMIKTALDAKTFVPKNKLSMYIDIIYYHNAWRNILGLSRSLFNYDNYYNKNNKGFYFADSSPKLTKLADYTDVTQRAELTPLVRKTMTDILDYCSREKMEVLFYVPCYDDPSEKSKMIYNTLTDMASEYGYSTINLNDKYDELGIDKNSDFYNINHVNTKGAIKVTDYMSKYIYENYDLTDHRNQSEFSQWNKDSKVFSSKVDEFLEYYDKKYSEASDGDI